MNTSSTLEERQYSHIIGLKIVKPFNRATASNETTINGEEDVSQTSTAEDNWSTRDETIMHRNVVNFFNQKLSVEIQNADIADIHTLPPRDSNDKGVCIVRFSNRLARDRIYQARGRVKYEQIFINEHTAKNAGLFRQARMLRRAEKVTHA